MRGRAKSLVLSLLILAVLLLAWHVASLPKVAAASAGDAEYAKLMGLDKPKSDGLPTLAIRGIWLLQVLLIAVAAAGAVRLVRSGSRLEAALLVLPLIYVTAVHLPLLCEARQSLPVKPLVIVLAAVGITSLGTAGRKTPASL